MAWQEELLRWAQAERAREDRLWPVDEPFVVEKTDSTEAELRERAVESGLAWARAGRFQPSTPEVTAAITARLAPSGSLASYATRVAERVTFLMMSRRALENGDTLQSLLSLLRPGPAEAQLQHARLLAIELQTLTDLPIVTAKGLADELLEIWAQHRAARLQVRCGEVLLRIARVPDVAVRVFSECVARAIAGARKAASLRAGESPIDEAISSLLRGHTANETNQQEAARIDASAQRYANLAGALAGRQPLWWDDAWHAMAKEDADLSRAFLAGTALTIGDAAPATALLESIGDPRPEVRVAAWSALAAADSDEARHALASIAREPSVAGRAAVAGSLRLKPSSVELLRPLIEDPDPGVRSAAAFNLLTLSGLRDRDLDLLRADTRSPSVALRSSAARALAMTGAAGLELGPLLVEAAVAESSAGAAPGAHAARALALWAGSEPAWMELYQRAASEREWLIALGAALSEEWAGLFPSPASQADAVRVHALQNLGNDDTQVAAAMVLAKHPDPSDKLFDVFSTGQLPESELAVLTFVSSTASRPHPALAEALWTWIDDDSAELTLRRAATSALGHLAPPSDANLSRLRAVLDGPLVDEAYDALWRILDRQTQQTP